jgi:hypothetical protein
LLDSPAVSGKQVCDYPDAYFSSMLDYSASGLPFFLVFGASIREFCLNCAPGSCFQVNFADSIRKFTKNAHREPIFPTFR